MLAIRLVCFALICLAAADDSNESADSGSSEEDDCTCVPFHLCPNGVQGYDGSGKIVFKLDSDRPNKCSTYSLRSCCKSKSQPLTSTTTPKPANRVGCGRRNSHGIVYKIVDDAGIASQFGEFPWMTMIYMEREGTEVKREIIPQCGGALIHEKVVLTAAHCAAKLTIPSAGVRLGEWDLRTETEQWSHQDRSITKMISHENYDPDHLYNDVALLVLGENVTIGNHIDILCLPRANDVVVNSTCVATGWGKNLTGNYQHVLKMVELPMVARDECQAKLRTLPGFENFELHESFTCAGGVEGKDTCKGDGGGALACPIPGHPGRYQQVGIVAWGPADCGKPVPAVYVDVAHFRSWIDQKMSQLGFETEYNY